MTGPSGPLAQFDDVTTVEELIGTAIGAGSMCWEHPGGAGVFDSDRASLIVEEVVTKLGRMGIPAGTPLTAVASMGPGDNAPRGHVCTVPVATPEHGRASCGRGCGRRYRVLRDEWVPV